MLQNYAAINGLKLYYEIHGTGTPLVLLHGAFGSIARLGDILPALAEHHQVIAVDLQGHGRTADIDRPLRHDTMADDIAVLVAHLGIAPADIMGYSFGGGVALQTAIRHPNVVRKLIVVSAAYKRLGYTPSTLAKMDAIPWLRTEYDWSAGVAAISAPTLLVFGGADAIRPEHIVEFHALLGSTARLAILPGLTHGTMLTSPLLATTVIPFIDESIDSVRR